MLLFTGICRTYIKTGILAILLFPVHLSSWAAWGGSRPDTTDYYNETRLEYNDHYYKPEIHSVILHKDGFELSDAVIQLGTSDQFRLEFDDLQGSIRQYYYTFIHCDATWHPTDLWYNEFIEGSAEELIENYEFSFNTRQLYTHYSLLFPNNRMGIKLSGNYLLKVYSKHDDGSTDLAFTRRFLVFDPKVSINATVLRATTIEDYETKQEIDFQIYTNGFRIDAPYQDIYVSVLQNGRWDNALTTLKPLIVRSDVLDYSYDNGTNQFTGGNEFRRFDMKSVRSISEKIREIISNDTGYDVRLWDSERRSFKVYVEDDDINGKFLLKTDDESAVSTMGEYANVHFFLPYSTPVAEGSLYVSGGFNNWQYSNENRMNYNFTRHGYEACIRLKQGYYNYQYVFLPNHSSEGDVTYVEGSHYQTGNNYTILVYYRERGTTYDQLIAMGNFDSRKGW